MTLQQLIERHEAHTAAQRPSVALTPRGRAIVAAQRSARQLAALAPEDRAAVRELLTDEPPPAS